MREVLPELLRWWRAGATVGVGTVVATWRSAPRPAGAAMLVGSGGEAVGSVSGGCVEGAVYELAQAVVADGVPVLQRYGVSDDDAYAVGLTCGGILDVFVERVSRDTFPELEEVADDIEAGRPVAVATVIEHPDPEWVGRRLVVRPETEGPTDSGARGSLGSSRADDAVTDDARGMLASGRTETLTYGPDGERRGEGMRVFVSSFAPKPRMLVFGAIDFAAAVAHQGHFLGFHVTVCDARPVFATSSRFPSADEVVVTDAVALQDRYTVGHDGLGELVNGSLDATAADRADRLSPGTDEHRRAGRPGRRAPRAHDGANAHRGAGPPPAEQLGEHLTHGRPPPPAPRTRPSSDPPRSRQRAAAPPRSPAARAGSPASRGGG